MNMALPRLNFGKLKDKVETAENIVYYKQGLEELSLNITNACPNACVFCIRDRDAGWGVSNLYLERDPTISEILGVFDVESARVEKSGIELKKVKICGYGEPILRFNDLFPISKHVKGAYPNADIQLATTGWPYFRFISQDTYPLKQLKDAGMSHIFLSLNATDPERYKKIVRPGIEQPDENAFSDTLRFARAVRDAGYEVALGFVNLPGTNEEKVKRMASKLGIKYRLREFED